MQETSPESNPQKGLEQSLTKESVIESLQMFPNDNSLLVAYVEQAQKLIQASYVSREDTEIRQFKFNLELAEIYRDAGLTENAADAYNDVADYAERNGMDKELAAILAELAKI